MQIMRAMATMLGASKDTGSKQTNFEDDKEMIQTKTRSKNKRKRSAIGATGVHYLWGQAVVMVGCTLVSSSIVRIAVFTFAMSFQI